MRSSAAARLLLAPSMRRAWQQQSGLGRIAAILSPSSLPLLSFSTSSSATRTPPPNLHLLDRVFVLRMPFFARHGVHPAEAELGQRFEVDAEVFIDGLGKSVLAEGDETTSSSSSSSSSSAAVPVTPADSVSRTFDYSRIHDIAQEVVRDGPRAQLVETLAARIADALLKEGRGETESPPASLFEVVGARVRVTKPGAPIQGVFGEAGVEVVRWKEQR